MPARPLVAAVVAAGILAACARDAADQVVGEDPAPTTSTTATTAASSAGAGSGDLGAAVPELLDFEAATVDGSTVDVAGFAGKDLVVWFWAPW